MLIKRLFLTCMLLGTFNQTTPSTDRHSKWIEYLHNEMVQRKQVVPKQKHATLQEPLTSTEVAAIVLLATMYAIPIGAVIGYKLGYNR